MKKGFKSSISLCLAAVLLLSVAVSALAVEAKENTKQYQSVCVIGDSSSAGYGLGNLDYSEGNSWWGQGWPKAHFGVHPDAFPGLIKDALSADYYSMTCVGLRLVDALWILGDYEDDYDRQEAYDYHYVHQNSQTRWQAMERMHDTGEGMDNVRKASLVVISIGANDAFTYPKNSSTDPQTGEMDYELLVKRLAEGFTRFSTCYPKLLDRIKDLNPNCEIVLVGQFNPYKNFNIQEDDRGVGRLTDAYIRDMNGKAKLWAAAYGATYVDVTEIGDSFPAYSLTEEDFLDKFGNMDNHPDKDGHQLIAQKVLDVLPEKESRVNAPTSGINHLVYGGEDAGSYIARRSGLGWTLKTLDGKYVCYDEQARQIVYRTSNPTVWLYNQGFHITIPVTTVSRSPILRFPITVRSSVSVYLTGANGAFAESSTTATPAIYVNN